MAIADLLLPEFDNETATTRRVLAEVPDDRPDWKPHEKAFTVAHLAQLVSGIPSWTPMIVEDTEFDLAPPGKPKASPYSNQTIEKLLADFDKNVIAARAAIANTSDEDFEVQWTLKSGGNVIMTMPRYAMLRSMMLNHLVHHRAQLGLYLRMLGCRVPSMYGPSADDK
ncbi:MAG TPA: DinB family protein [Gemmatimonadaceae bacterium]|jgi:uncharacterized damage-inducible protein DinB